MTDTPDNHTDPQYLAYILVNELHRQRELLTTLCLLVATTDEQRDSIKTLTEKHNNFDYQIPLNW